MTTEMWITLAVLVMAIVLFVTEWVRLDIVALGVVVILMLTGILDVNEAIAGFSSTSVLVIAALFVVGGAVLHTGLAAMIAERVLGISGTNETVLLVVLIVVVAVMSGFISSTGVVAVMMPAVLGIAHKAKLSPSRLLIPLAFGSLLGGALTLIGTAPNIIISDVLRDGGYEPFGFFAFSPIGILLLVVGVLFMVIVGRHLLPDRKPQGEIQEVETPEELLRLYRLPDNLFRLRVRSRSALAGQTLAGSGFGTRFDVHVLEIVRRAEPITLAKLGEGRIMVQSGSEDHIREVIDTELHVDDILIVQGTASDISRAAAYWTLAIQPASLDDQQALLSQEVGVAEVLLPQRSSLIGKTLADARFGSHHHLTVLDIRRPGEDVKLNLKETKLSFGDTLLVQGEWGNIAALRRFRRDFIVMGASEKAIPGGNRKKAPLALLLLLVMMVLIVTGWASITAASMLTALGMVLVGCLSMDEAYDSVDWKSIVLIAGMLPMATALEKVGLVTVAADGFTTLLGSAGPTVVMAGLFLLTMLFTQVLSNTATAVLVAPIALATAQQMGVSPQAMMMAVAIAASMAFASPIASPVNTLVMGAGNYSFADYMKVGAPLAFAEMIVVVLILPTFWPF